MANLVNTKQKKADTVKFIIKYLMSIFMTCHIINDTLVLSYCVDTISRKNTMLRKLKNET